MHLPLLPPAVSATARKGSGSTRLLPAGMALLGLALVTSGCSAASAQDAAAKSDAATSASTPLAGGEAPATLAAATPTPAKAASIELSATGDIVMGNAPNALPANDGQGFFDGVKQALAADLVMGNLEEPLTEETTLTKCGGETSGCYQFRVPPHYAGYLADAGFEVVNNANNHAYDYGPEGYQNTGTSLAGVGIQRAGDPGSYVVEDVNGVKVAVIGFSPYATSNQLTDIPAAQALIRRAAAESDIVVVQAHMGAEGADRLHLTGENEIFYDEDRGNPIEFARAAVDAGADIIIGHGPHVMRGMEFYNGKLIAYSLGNFAGGGNQLASEGATGIGGILKVRLNSDGSYNSGQLVSTYMDGAGVPTLDPNGSAVALVSQLSAEDLSASAAKFGPDGSITP
ncbi:MAG: CapA family protein [Actinobacteria bacterium]|nr:MAG: CapA family protein [Actinomycetota bacterium]